MATYVNDLRLKEIATGDESGTWGTSTNTNLELIAEAFSFGTEGITTNADTHTTTIADGATDPGRSIFLKYTGTLDSACTITIGPNTVSKLWLIENATSGSQDIIIKQGSGATVTIANGQTKAIYSDGAGSGGAMVDAFTDLAIPSLFVEGATTITTADNLTQLTLKSTDTDANVGPRMDLTRDSSSPAASDSLGQIRFMGEDAGDNSISYAHMTSFIVDPTDGSEDGKFEIDVRKAGTQRSRLLLDENETVFNNEQQDIDFRVESDGNANMLFVDAGNDHVNIGTSTDYGGVLNIETTDNSTNLLLASTDTDANAGPILVLYRQSASSAADGDAIGKIDVMAYNDANQNITYAQIAGLISDASDGSEDGQLQINIMSSASSRSFVDFIGSTGTVFNEGSVVNLDFRIESDSNTHMLFVDAGNDRVMVGKSSTGLANQGVEFEDGQIKGTATGQTVAFLNRASDDGTILDVRKDNSVVGTLGSNSAGGVPTFDISSNSSSGIIRLLTSGSEAVRIDNNGLVGIGNSSPSSFNALADNLVVGTTSGSNGISIVAATDGNSSIYFADGTSGSGQQLPGYIQYGHSSNALVFGAATLQHLKLDGSVVINEDSNDLDVRIETDSNNSAFVIDASDNEIELNANTFSGGQFTLGSSSFFLNVTSGYRFNDQANSVNLVVIGNSGEMVVNEGSQDYDFRVESNNKTNMLFVDGGNDCVVIGGSTVETSDQFEVLGNDSNTTVRIRNTNAGAAGPLLVFDKSSSSPANDDVCGEIRFLGNDSSGNATQFAGFKVESGNVTNGGEDAITTYGMQVNGSYQNMFNMNHIGTTFNEGGIGALDFRVESTSASHMLYVNSGDNTVTFDNSDFSTIDGSSATGVAIRTAGRMVFCGTDGGNIMEFNINGTGNVGTIRLSGSNTAYNTTSDERLKENIADAEDAGAIIDAIQVRQFDWKIDGEHQRYGMVAQELNTVTPEAVTVPDDPEKMHGVDYSKLVPMLIKEIQSLRSRIAKLEGE